MILCRSTIRNAMLVAAFLLFVLLGWATNVQCAAAGTKGKTVWIVFFFSRSCPNCEPVRELLHALKRAYPIHVKEFNIDRPEHYTLYSRLEAIHASNSFGVPLVMLDDSILMGEQEIANKLEKMVIRLSRNGGASLPYLGPKPTGDRERGSTSTEPSESETCQDCNGRGRPPTIQEEWRKIRKFVDTYF